MASRHACVFHHATAQHSRIFRRRFLLSLLLLVGTLLTPPCNGNTETEPVEVPGRCVGFARRLRLWTHNFHRPKPTCQAVRQQVLLNSHFRFLARPGNKQNYVAFPPE